MTEDAQRFVTPLSFQAITHRPVFDNLWAPGMETDIAHVTLGRESDVIVVAPATAHMLAKLAHGLADDPVSVTALAARCPLIVAPAMDAGMYTHPATAANIQTLRSRDVTIVEPETGHLASGLTGLGRLADPDTIVDAIRAVLGARGDLVGRTVAVTAGGTLEPIDPVRFISNRSSGKMGYAIAEAARDRGARVVLITTPTALRAPGGMDVVRVEQAMEMLDALRTIYARLDALIMAAAVADFRVDEPPIAEGQARRRRASACSWCPIPICSPRRRPSRRERQPVRVGFAAETQDLHRTRAIKVGRERAWT